MGSSWPDFGSSGSATAINRNRSSKHRPARSADLLVGPAGPEQDAGPDTDFHAVRAGYVAITPLQVDLTRHGALTTLTQWLQD